MKKIVRLLTLVGVVSFAAIPPALSQYYGTCSYSCANGDPSQRQKYSYSSTEEECCEQSRETMCDPGMWVVGHTFNGTKCWPVVP